MNSTLHHVIPAKGSLSMQVPDCHTPIRINKPVKPSIRPHTPVLGKVSIAMKLPLTVEKVHKCKLGHSLEDLLQEDNNAYWAHGCFLHGIVCSHCNFVFEKTRPSQIRKEINPSSVYFCPNLMECNGAICKIAMCAGCWNKVLLERDGISQQDATLKKSKRKRTAKTIMSV